MREKRSGKENLKKEMDNPYFYDVAWLIFFINFVKILEMVRVIFFIEISFGTYRHTNTHPVTFIWSPRSIGYYFISEKAL